MTDHTDSAELDRLLLVDYGKPCFNCGHDHTDDGEDAKGKPTIKAWHERQLTAHLQAILSTEVTVITEGGCAQETGTLADLLTDESMETITSLIKPHMPGEDNAT